MPQVQAISNRQSTERCYLLDCRCRSLTNALEPRVVCFCAYQRWSSATKTLTPELIQSFHVTQPLGNGTETAATSRQLRKQGDVLSTLQRQFATLESRFVDYQEAQAAMAQASCFCASVARQRGFVKTGADPVSTRVFGTRGSSRHAEAYPCLW